MDTVALSVGPRYRDLVGFRINRVWPTARRRLVGPFIFYDHMLRCELPPGKGLDVPPHPHIGLATVTYLFEGELMHRDSLGTAQLIRPGELNWMIAGRGITHSERSSTAARAHAGILHGTQAWVALPRAAESAAPGFVHVPARELPERDWPGIRVRLLAGDAFGLSAPLPGISDLHYVEASCESGSVLELPAALGQRAAYIVDGALRCAGGSYESGQLLVFADAVAVHLEMLRPCHLMLFGGQRLDEDRFIWWNFVATTQARIDAARRRWADGEFPDVPGDAGAMAMPDA